LVAFFPCLDDVGLFFWIAHRLLTSSFFACAPDEIVHPALGNLYLPPRCFLRLLLKSVQKYDPPPSIEKVEHAINVRSTFSPQLPQLALNMLDQWLSGTGIERLQLPDRIIKSGLRFEIETAQKRLYGAAASFIDVKYDVPRLFICHDIRILV
jgi:hypothetical protein